jgi:hypothetical protein
MSRRVPPRTKRESGAPGVVGVRAQAVVRVGTSGAKKHGIEICSAHPSKTAKGAAASMWSAEKGWASPQTGTVMKRFPRGAEITVRVDPEKPNRSVVDQQ